MYCNKKLVHIKVSKIQEVKWLKRHSKIILEPDYNVFVLHHHVTNFQKDYTEANLKNWEKGEMDGLHKGFSFFGFVTLSFLNIAPKIHPKKEIRKQLLFPSEKSTQWKHFMFAQNLLQEYWKWLWFFKKIL